MLTDMKTFSRAFIGALLCLVFSASASAATTLLNCFGAPQEYNISYDRDLNASENITHHEINVDHLVGDGMEMEANCSCPKNISGTTPVLELTLAGSPLSPGVSGYGYLTDKVDIDVRGYTDAVNSPDGGGLFGLNINQYPTSPSSMPNTIEDIKTKEGTASVCSTSTRPSDSTSVKRKFKLNVIGAKFYIKKPIIGKEAIPTTLVVQNYTCLYFGSGSCDITGAQQVSNIWLSGSLSAPLSCTINEGSTIEVDFGNIVSKQFNGKSRPPQGYALKNVDISYHCDDNAIGNNDRIKLTLTADQGVVDSSDPLVAKMLDKDDVGVRIYDENNQNVALDGTFEFPVPMDDQGNGVVRIKAAPVSTTGKTPEPGQFEGNVTVKMDLR
ncbi:fimbrial protein [Enterobacter sp. 638]|uniref:Fimbrial protein n=1 Tax=Enterobacter sp. (strain 638) TaxID=399742 RepID=A0A9J9GHI2_ENT38|nr:fimbrial protein [Enterobacter sp. 638]ABP61120.1 Fimbrial protein [Enterobacter sp. 638]